MKRLISLTLFAFYLSAHYLSAHAGNEVTGEAYSEKSGELMYCETHQYSADGMTHKVSYTDSAGRTLVRKTLSYKTGLSTPSFKQTSYTQNQQIAVRQSQGQVVMSVGTPSKPKQAAVDIKQPLVIDAGFNHFIRQNWNQLTKGEPVHFYFAFPKRGQLIPLRIQESRCEAGRGESTCFKIDLKNWLLRLIAPPMELTYDNQRRLLRYKGLSNIDTEKDRQLIVDIRYRYTSEKGNCEQNFLPVISDISGDDQALLY